MTQKQWVLEGNFGETCTLIMDDSHVTRIYEHRGPDGPCVTEYKPGCTDAEEAYEFIIAEMIRLTKEEFIFG